MRKKVKAAQGRLRIRKHAVLPAPFWLKYNRKNLPIRQYGEIFSADFISKIHWQNCFAPKKSKFCAELRRDGAGMPRDWLPNDGLVNTISARYPGGAPHTDFVPGQTPVRGVWQVLPVEHLDHLAAIGGVMNNGVVRTRLFYRRVMALLDAAAAADANS